QLVSVKSCNTHQFKVAALGVGFNGQSRRREARTVDCFEKVAEDHVVQAEAFCLQAEGLDGQATHRDELRPGCEDLFSRSPGNENRHGAAQASAALEMVQGRCEACASKF